MSEFDKINDLAGWRAKLGELLDAAKDAAKQKLLAPRLAINERLIQFVENSPPNTDGIKALDDIATQAASGLMRKTIEERLESISERTGTFLSLSKQLESSAEINKSKAQSIRLQAITGFIDSATKVAEAAKELQKSLKETGGDAKVADKILEIITSIETLRSSLGKQI